MFMLHRKGMRQHSLGSTIKSQTIINNGPASIKITKSDLYI